MELFWGEDFAGAGVAGGLEASINPTTHPFLPQYQFVIQLLRKRWDKDSQAIPLWASRGWNLIFGGGRNVKNLLLWIIVRKFAI